MAVSKTAPVHKKEPVITAAVVVGVIVTIASVFNIVIDPNTLTTVVAAGLPVVAALWARLHVTPV